TDCRPENCFRFSHELIRQAVTSALSPPRRALLHLDISAAIERVYANTLEDHTNDLAYHMWQAGTSADPIKTICHLARAAKRGMVAGAYEDASGHLLNALEVIKRLPQNSERSRRELELRLTMGAVLLTTKGYATPELEKPIARMLELCDQVDDPVMRI